MTEFQYQFQYDPGDLKAVRDANGSIQISPATTITVWAIGFAICLLALGVMAAWTVLATVFVLACFFIAYYVSRLGRRGLADREYRFRTVTLTEDSVSEEFGNSLTRKTWSAFDTFNETAEHFLLQHYEKITAIPKRVVPQDELDVCREFIVKNVHGSDSRDLEDFGSWFKEVGAYPVYSFRWQDEDIRKLGYTRMQRYGDSDDPSIDKGNPIFRMLSSAGLLVLIAAAVFLSLNFIFTSDGNLPSQVLLFALAISIPFLFAFVWWRITKFKVRNRKPRIPEEEIYVTCNTESLLVGYPKAIASYSWQDIESFFYSDDFVGFKPSSSMVHVIANHAFGGKTFALEFLRIADSLRREKQFGFESRDNQTVDSIETGNPFQTPGSLSL